MKENSNSVGYDQELIDQIKREREGFHDDTASIVYVEAKENLKIIMLFKDSLVNFELITGQNMGLSITEYKINKARIPEFENKTIELDVEGVGLYGRTLGRIYSGGDYINLKLVELGLAHSYIVKDKELEEFKNAEKEAREKGMGIWKRSEHYNCLNAAINKKDEKRSFLKKKFWPCRRKSSGSCR